MFNSFIHPPTYHPTHRAGWVKHYVPYQRHTGNLRQEVRTLEMRVNWLKEEAKRLGYRGKEEEEEEEAN